MLEYVCFGDNPDKPVVPFTDVPKTIEQPISASIALSSNSTNSTSIDPVPEETNTSNTNPAVSQNSSSTDTPASNSTNPWKEPNTTPTPNNTVVQPPDNDRPSQDSGTQIDTAKANLAMKFVYIAIAVVVVVVFLCVALCCYFCRRKKSRKEELRDKVSQLRTESQADTKVQTTS